MCCGVWCDVSIRFRHESPLSFFASVPPCALARCAIGCSGLVVSVCLTAN